MTQLSYTVRAAFDDASVCQEFIDWLEHDHAAKVIQAGALSAEIVLLDHDSTSEQSQVEVRYLFADRRSLDRYLRDSAPALRLEGLAKFPAGRGVTMSRRIGTVQCILGCLRP